MQVGNWINQSNHSFLSSLQQVENNISIFFQRGISLIKGKKCHPITSVPLLWLLLISCMCRLLLSSFKGCPRKVYYKINIGNNIYRLYWTPYYAQTFGFKTVIAFLFRFCFPFRCLWIYCLYIYKFFLLKNQTPENK